MRRRDALKVLAGLAAISTRGGVARAFQGPADDVPLPDLMRKLLPIMGSIPIGVAPLGPGLSLITGPGGNIAALTGPDGVVLVDAFVPGRGAELASAARKLGGGPITLVNTHWHSDHAGGNAELAAAGARIVAHGNTRKRL